MYLNRFRKDIIRGGSCIFGDGFLTDTFSRMDFLMYFWDGLKPVSRDSLAIRQSVPENLFYPRLNKFSLLVFI